MCDPDITDSIQNITNSCADIDIASQMTYRKLVKSNVNKHLRNSKRSHDPSKPRWSFI